MKNIESILEEDDTVTPILKLFIATNDALGTSYQRIKEEAEKEMEDNNSKSSTSASSIHFNLSLLCSDLLEVFDVAYQYSIQGAKESKKSNTSGSGNIFNPKYKIECFLLELNKLIEIELSHNEFEELRAVAKSGVSTISQMDSINVIIKREGSN